MVIHMVMMMMMMLILMIDNENDENLMAGMVSLFSKLVCLISICHSCRSNLLDFDHYHRS